MKNYSSLNGKECPQRWVMEYKAARLVALALKTDRNGKKAELKKCILFVRRTQKEKRGVPDGLSL